jgi:hypothetical protein
MEERRIALPFVKPASLIISTISKPDLFNGSLANNFVAKSLAPLFIGIGLTHLALFLDPHRSGESDGGFLFNPSMLPNGSYI